METQEATQWKQKGNEAFKEKRFHSAIQSYTKSLEILPDPLVFGNRAQAEINAELYLLAQVDCTAAIQLNPTLPKNFYRRAVALKSLGLNEEALKDVEKCLELTKDQAASVLLSELKNKKNAPVINVSPIERDHYLDSSEEFIDVPISYEGLVPENDFEPASSSEMKTQLDDKKKLFMPPNPTSYVDFASAKNYLADEPVLLAEYFLIIDESQYHDLFDDLLDDQSATLIVKSLAFYLNNNQNEETKNRVSEKLLKLAEVSRFDVVIMLMDIEGKTAISEICKIVSSTHANLIQSIYL